MRHQRWGHRYIGGGNVRREPAHRRFIEALTEPVPDDAFHVLNAGESVIQHAIECYDKRPFSWYAIMAGPLGRVAHHGHIQLGRGGKNSRVGIGTQIGVDLHVPVALRMLLQHRSAGLGGGVHNDMIGLHIGACAVQNRASGDDLRPGQAACRHCRRKIQQEGHAGGIPHSGYAVGEVCWQFCLIPHMHMHIDQTGHQYLTLRVNLTRTSRGDHTVRCPHLLDLATGNQHRLPGLQYGTLPGKVQHRRIAHHHRNLRRQQ